MRTAISMVAGVAALAVAGPAAPATVAATTPHTSPHPAQVVLDWERVAFATVYPTTPIPNGVPILGFTSMAMKDAAQTSLQRGTSSETAAVAVAAHDVLLHYYPSAAAALDAKLASSLADVPNGQAERKGARLGRAAAAEMLRSRVGDGYGDPDIHYTLLPGVGVWQPSAPATDMLAAWIGSLRPLVLEHFVQVDGPDPLSSATYGADFNEVRSLGSLASSSRTQEQTDTALFFNSNSATMLGDALIRRLEAEPVSLALTAHTFAAMHASMTDALIRCWQLKRDVGFWRPSQAVAGADDDRNPDTAKESGWTPLLANPPYSDYVSGHACLTGSAAEVIRQTFGDDITLELRSSNFPGLPRVYTSLEVIERDALNSRIWGGLHFRDAMDDGYAVAHRTARRVLRELS